MTNVRDRCVLESMRHRAAVIRAATRFYTLATGLIHSDYREPRTAKWEPPPGHRRVLTPRGTEWWVGRDIQQKMR